MKNYGDLRGCYPSRPTASPDNILLQIFGLVNNVPVLSIHHFCQLWLNLNNYESEGDVMWFPSMF